MKRVSAIAMLLVLVAGTARAERAPNALIVTTSNQATNQLLVYDTAGTLVQTIPTGGQGGAGGNAGGVAVRGATVAVVNFGSSSISIFHRRDDRFERRQIIPVSSPPVSVAFSKNHLYALGTTSVESHPFSGMVVDSSPDGIGTLVRADGSAAQVGVVGDQLIITEKSDVVETFDLRAGAVLGDAQPVPLPAGSDTPFGLVTRGANAYVAIAHSDELAVIRRDRVVTVTATGTPGGSGQHSPCWLALVGPFLYTANSPSPSVSRRIAAGTNLIVDAPVAASFIGAPTDIAASRGLVAVVDGSADVSRVTQFSVDDDGNLTQISQAAIAAPINGIAIVH